MSTVPQNLKSNYEKVAYTKLHARPATNHMWDKLVVSWKRDFKNTRTISKITILGLLMHYTYSTVDMNTGISTIQ